MRNPYQPCTKHQQTYCSAIECRVEEREDNGSVRMESRPDILRENLATEVSVLDVFL